MARASHPPYSRDLAPSDLYFFGFVKHSLGNPSFETAGREAVVRYIESMQIYRTNAVFLDWM
jgi:hypothetical protein